MAKCIIVLDDVEGEVAMTVQFVDGYNAHSHAHGQAALMIKQLDERAARSAPMVETTNVHELNSAALGESALPEGAEFVMPEIVSPVLGDAGEGDAGAGVSAASDSSVGAE